MGGIKIKEIVEQYSTELKKSDGDTQNLRKDCITESFTNQPIVQHPPNNPTNTLDVISVEQSLTSPNIPTLKELPDYIKQREDDKEILFLNTLNDLNCNDTIKLAKRGNGEISASQGMPILSKKAIVYDHTSITVKDTTKDNDTTFNIHNETIRKQLFVHLYLANFAKPLKERVSTTNIAIQSGYSRKGAAVRAWEILNDPPIKQYIEEELRKMRDMIGWSIQQSATEAVHHYKRLVNQDGKEYVALKFKEDAGKLLGHYVDRSISLNMTARIDYEELDKIQDASVLSKMFAERMRSRVGGRGIGKKEIG